MNIENQSVKKKVNPLYVVNVNGIDVEEAKSIFELLLKKSGLDMMIPILEAMMKMLLQEIESYPVFLEIKKFLDQILNVIIDLIAKIQKTVHG